MHLIKQTCIFICTCTMLLAARDGYSHTQVNFDLAMQGLHFSLTADDNGKQGGNGIPDATEMALVARVLNNANYDSSQHGGVSHQITQRAYQKAMQQAKQDLASLSRQWPTSPEVVVGYTLLGDVSHSKIAQMVAAFGAKMQGDYANAIALGRYFAANGDADGDGVSNLEEYRAHQAKGREAYLNAALDPKITVSGTLEKSPPAEKLKVGIVLYPGFEVLDLYGPLQMWAYVPDFEILLIAEQKGPVASAQKVATVATHSFDDITTLDVLMLPGGMGTFEQLENPKLMGFIQRMDAKTRYTASVCTGSALLAKAGVLDGQKATANKRFFFLSQQQSRKTEWIPEARWVESGKYFTSSGVSAGTDMALGLLAKHAGKKAATDMASLLEYQWNSDASHDPFVQFVKVQPEQEQGTPKLLESYPKQTQTLTQSPQYLHLLFSHNPNVAKSQIRLFNEEGESLALYGLHTMGSNDLMIMLNKPLIQGTYKVEWQAAFDTDSPIDHAKGSFQFNIQIDTSQ